MEGVAGLEPRRDERADAGGRLRLHAQRVGRELVAAAAGAPGAAHGDEGSCAPSELRAPCSELDVALVCRQLLAAGAVGGGAEGHSTLPGLGVGRERRVFFSV